MIRLERVSKRYVPHSRAPVTAVDAVDLEIAQGELVVITGRSGSGKTTLLNLAAGLTRPTEGTARLDGVDWWSLPDRRQSLLRNRKVGFVFQFPSLMPALTAVENVALPSLLEPGGDRRAATRRASALLEDLGLEDRRGSLPRQLSAGEQQRVVIARALLQQPELIFADEPTSDLDEETEAEIVALLTRIHAEEGVTVVLVTHAGSLVRFGTRALRMARGRIVEDTART